MAFLIRLLVNATALLGEYASNAARNSASTSHSRAPARHSATARGIVSSTTFAAARSRASSSASLRMRSCRTIDDAL